MVVVIVIVERVWEVWEVWEMWEGWEVWEVWEVWEEIQKYISSPLLCTITENFFVKPPFNQLGFAEKV
ncbi:MAG: hypothetical protein F6K40_33290 [Okeania sp. SIO3I5]|uniref:hypothetical protein n=1 Tax=Okeania sp. SIO3I5 TaxID=2607805 RepID=UPI0013B8EC93|nr:hypothetical protein [Okeania sp. SIO3I5]NEQ40835.1 hypothetical protein [Okeania sp. SIO3I5]